MKKHDTIFRRKFRKLLNRLVKKGCGHWGGCMCILCRIMRIARTEEYRNDLRFKSEWIQQMNSESKKTTMIDWRGGLLEFVIDDKNDKIAGPPWYVVRYCGKFWTKDKWNYIWIDYVGPPKVFLTKANAIKEAKNFRKQYGGGEQFGNGPLKVEIVKIMPNSKDLTIKSEDQEFITKLKSIFGGSNNISGYNPLDCIQEKEELKEP